MHFHFRLEAPLVFAQCERKKMDRVRHLSKRILPTPVLNSKTKSSYEPKRAGLNPTQPPIGENGGSSSNKELDPHSEMLSLNE